MATVNIVRTNVENIAVNGGSMPVANSLVKNTETITSSGISQASTDVAVAPQTEFWIITVSGGPVWVHFAAAPVAVVGTEWLILDGQTREFSCTAGDKVAVIDG